jgi:hypothetical protein
VKGTDAAALVLEEPLPKLAAALALDVELEEPHAARDGAAKPAAQRPPTRVTD